MKRRNFATTVAVVAGVGGLLGRARFAVAQISAPDAARFIKDLSVKAIADLTDLSLNDVERARRFDALLRENFDVPEIGRFVLGRFWRMATEAERAEYLKLFEGYLVQIYAKRFKEYTGENLRVDQTRPGNDNEIVVLSTIVRSQIGPAQVAWRLRREGAGFRIVDVSVEGVSLALTHRDDFAAVIQRGGNKVEALLVMLRIRTAGV